MLFKKKSRIRPLYKQLNRLRANVQNRKKLLNFKKKKWSLVINSFKSRFKWYKKNRLIEQIGPVSTGKPDYWCSYKNSKYKNVLLAYQKIKLFYGGFTKKKIKKTFRKLIGSGKPKNIRVTIIRFYESRLDSTLYRAKFISSVSTARRLIKQGNIIRVNGKKIINPAYNLQTGDLVSINPKYKKIVINTVINSYKWPLPPKYLHVSYKTLQIIFGDVTKKNLIYAFEFNLGINSLANDFLKA